MYIPILERREQTNGVLLIVEDILACGEMFKKYVEHIGIELEEKKYLRHVKFQEIMKSSVKGKALLNDGVSEI